MSTQKNENNQQEKQKKPGNLKDEKVDIPRPGKKDQKEKTTKTKPSKEDGKGKKKKGCFNCRNCGCSCLAVLLIVILVPLYAVAASGAVNIPLLTPLVYGDDPLPREEVKAADISEDVIGKKIEKAVKNNSKTISLSEEELTGFLKSQGAFPNVNISITEENLEFYGNVQNGPYDVILTTQQTPTIENGQLDVDFDKVRIGKLNLPLLIVNPIAQNALSKYQDQLGQQLKNIEKIELEKDKALITANWQKMAKEQLEKEQKDKQPPPTEKEVPQKIQGL